jgi:4-hydroxyphenylpyruvate dioxygenase
MQNDQILEGAISVSEPADATPLGSSTSDVYCARPVAEESKLQLDAVDHIHLYVGNAYQAMRLLCTTFGFHRIGYRGLETGSRDRVSYVLGQGDIRIVVTSSLDSASDIAEEVKVHGDAVKEIAFATSNAEEAFHLALAHGAAGVADPVKDEDAFGSVTTAAIRAFGDVVHRFVERSDYTGSFLPGYQAQTGNGSSASCFVNLDHLAMSLPEGQLDEMTEFYTRTLDMHAVHEETVITGHSGMRSRVVQNSAGTVRFPMMEPIAGRGRSQIAEYLKYNRGAGIQHVAFASYDLIQAVRECEAAGAEFLKTPGTYYDALSARVGAIAEAVMDLRDCNILVDRDRWGYLLQIFSKPITARPTLFMELIQRAGARGFGSGNIRALFDAVEREQALRGNL